MRQSNYDYSHETANGKNCFEMCAFAMSFWLYAIVSGAIVKLKTCLLCDRRARNRFCSSLCFGFEQTKLRHNALLIAIQPISLIIYDSFGWKQLKSQENLSSGAMSPSCCQEKKIGMIFLRSKNFNLTLPPNILHYSLAIVKKNIVYSFISHHWQSVE